MDDYLKYILPLIGGSLVGLITKGIGTAILITICVVIILYKTGLINKLKG